MQSLRFRKVSFWVIDEFNSKLSYKVSNMANKNKPPFVGDVSDQYVIYQPDGVTPLFILEGISLYILAPITQPARADLYADAFVNGVKLSNSKLTKQLVNRLVLENLHSAKD